MPRSIRDHYEAFPDPSPALVPIGPGQLDRVEDTLHYGWSWYRNRLAFRKSEGIRILDAGCGTGLSTLGLAKLNPGATVVGVDHSPNSLALARQRAEVPGMPTVEFREHDLTTPIPGDWGRFDFVVASRVLGNGDDPGAILINLTQVLDDRGLFLATFPSAAGRMPARQLSRAINALIDKNAPTADRARIGLDLLRAIRPDHPIRRFDAFRHGGALPSTELFVATYLNDRGTSWTLEAAIRVIGVAGLKCLYVADRGGWQPDKVFGPEVSDRLRERVAGLDEPSLARLKDALDISLHPDSYILYNCHEGHEPHTPAWPEEDNLAIVDRLVPHPTGLAVPANLNPDPASARGRVTYQMTSGAVGELDLRSHLNLRQVDGVRSVGEIEAMTTIGPFADDGPEARRARWFEVSNLGMVLLESPDPRQHVDCIHLGSIKDRLDCACPRRWVRGCERHGLCTISTVGPADPKAGVLSEALARLGTDAVMACDRCPDYSPEGG